MLKHNTSKPNKARTKISLTHDDFIHDPPLTPLGVDQARSIVKTYPFLSTSRPYLLISSPLRRTLQTALLAFSNRSPLPHPGFQENSAKPCDTGSSPASLRQESPELDFGLVVEGWDSKVGEWAPDEVSLAKRAARMRKWLKDHSENEIVVVTHGGTSFRSLNPFLRVYVDIKDSYCILLRR